MSCVSDGVPGGIFAIGDTRFTGELWRGLCRQSNIKQKMPTASHHQTDCQSACINQTIGRLLRCVLRGGGTKC